MPPLRIDLIDVLQLPVLQSAIWMPSIYTCFFPDFADGRVQEAFIEIVFAASH